ncbi:MAG: ATP-binding protein [Melioribacter sp.]|uniref:sensor histidine kinase n=1 Tax=Rosettibacter primus TaxID=3111523 RepID=UPI00247F0669|nr:ATP-binding protein [Melioribacter sp.]
MRFYLSRIGIKGIILICLMIILLLSGIIYSIFLRSNKYNWENLVKERIKRNESLIQNSFNEKLELLFNNAANIKNDVRSIIINNKFISDTRQYTSSILQIYDEQKNLLFWDSKSFLEQTQYFNSEFVGKPFFFDNDLFVYLTVIDTLQHGHKLFYLSVNIPVEKKYSLGKNKNFTNWSELLSQILNTNVEIIYNKDEAIKKDGRFHSYDLMNNNNKIATVIFEKPAVDFILNEMSNSVKTFQLILLFLIFFDLIWILSPRIKSLKNNLIRFLLYTLIAASIRLLLFIFNFPSSYFRNSLTNASYFSSTFAFGIVRSPLEFTITVITVLIIVSIGFSYASKYYLSNKSFKNSWKIFIALWLIFSFLILLIWRGLGASLRSVIFDSTIRYFKEFNLIPDTPTFLMDLNILLLGISAILFSLILLMLLYSFNPFKGNKDSSLKLFALLFVLLQISGWAFDNFQKQPQGTPAIRFVYISVIFLLTYLLLFGNFKNFLKYIYIAFGASIATVSLLTYYNSEIERESLKTTAQDLTRANQNIYQFMIYQTLNEIRNNKDVFDAFEKYKNFYSLAFVTWTKSLLHNESIPSFINFYDKEKKLKGYFSSFKQNISIIENELKDYNVTNDITIKILPNIFGDKTLIKGITAIKNNDSILGYAVIGALFEDINFRFLNMPAYFLSEQQGISSAINLERVKIFYFHNKKISKAYGSVILSQDDIKKFIYADFSKFNEAWLYFNIDKEKYLFYVLKLSDDYSKILAVGKEERDYTWSLSDFFKVFFIHSLIILLSVFIAALWNYKSLLKFLQSYRTKIAAVFVVVAIVPLIIFSVYFKNITEINNEEFNYNNLLKLSEQLKDYFHNYEKNNLKNNLLIFSKASEDLGLKFTVFRDKYLLFSTNENLYQSKLFSAVIPAKIYYDLQSKGYDRVLIKNEFEKINYNSLYFKIIFSGEEYIVEVNDLFNELENLTPERDINVFMFGIISLAVIMLIIFSTILANHISMPIRRLTNAMRSVGIGDLNIEVKGKYSGEIYELANGFNKMVAQLKKSQIELARIEREAAWKEMAKQVAHEIKNPLTPMKLSVQQLIAAYKDKSPKFDDIFDKVTSTVINQIEVLKNIATEFSNFARMPKLNVEKIDLKKVTEESINLFADEKLSIKYEMKNEIYVYADRDHLSRTIINLIRNSIQADAKNILITAETEGEFCFLRITDDGTGIPEENIEKVFDENFTTKKQGMGLGLSMAKKFLDSIGGSIEIEKTSENGTTFLIKIPVA